MLIPTTDAAIAAAAMIEQGAPLSDEEKRLAFRFGNEPFSWHAQPEESAARREIGKWLNEQPNRGVNRTALAELLSEYDGLAARVGEGLFRMNA